MPKCEGEADRNVKRWAGQPGIVLSVKHMLGKHEDLRLISTGGMLGMVGRQRRRAFREPGRLPCYEVDGPKGGQRGRVPS